MRCYVEAHDEMSAADLLQAGLGRIGAWAETSIDKTNASLRKTI
jgi:hypothetical protein